MAGPLGRRARVLDAEPDRPARRGPARPRRRPSLFVLDMFPYPSGMGLHVGHPLGYIATDVYARFQRMNGFNVLHAMGYDAFGLPAEQYAVQTGQHPRVTTEQNIATMKRQLRALGLGARPAARSGHDRRVVLPLDAVDLPADLQLLVRRRRRSGPPDRGTRRRVPSRRAADARRLPVRRPGASRATRTRRLLPARVRRRSARQLVPGPGHGARQRRGHGRRPQRPRQLPGVPAPAEAVDAAHHRVRRPAARRSRPLDWSDSMKLMQRNWIGRSTGANIRFPVEGREDVEVEVFTTRPDTIFGATFMVLAPEHPLVDEITADEWPGDDVFVDWESNPIDDWKGVFGMTGTPAEAVQRYREFAAREVAISSARPKAGQDRRVHRRLRRSTRRTTSASRCSSPTTC